VDDVAPWRAEVRRILGSQPEWEIVAEASDGLGALEKALEFQPDIVVLDIGLPGLNGIEVANEIRRRSPATNIVFLTQEGDSDIMHEALSVGQATYIMKANANRDLRDSIAAALRQD
jgi:DNA-binding NarL/FixJ family response regulator